MSLSPEPPQGLVGPPCIGYGCSMTSEQCTTCQGEGVTASEQGPLTCVDCAGLGQLPSGLVRTEWRLRELERIYQAKSGEQGQDFRWLITQLRRSHHALLQILAASQDGEDTPTNARVKFLANDVLSVYPKVDRDQGARS